MAPIRCTEVPPDALEGVVEAGRRFEELAALGRQVHFDLAGGSLRIELRDLEGATVRVLSATEAVALAEGAAP